MPISYEINNEEGVIYTTATGSLDDADIAGFKQALLSDRDYRPGMKELSDVRGVDDFRVTAAGIRSFAGMDGDSAELVKEHRLAIVATEDVIYGMARMYQAQTEKAKPNVQIFRDLQLAREGLGLE
ncbi:MAG: hypothetical protein ACYCXJ_06915 [Thermoleophilia bacterium]